LIAVAPLIFHIPLLGWVAAQLGCIPANRDSISNALSANMSVILVPGGVPEVVSYEKDKIYTNRHGFLSFDAPVLPVVTTSKHYYVPEAPLYDLRMFIAQQYSVPIIFPWIFGWKNTWLPKREALTVKVLEVKDRTQKSYFEEIKNTIYN
jgi:1-acyl-sn-glycerol-3-phosphate acyltransferase